MTIKKTTQEWTDVLNEAMNLHAKNAVSNLKFDKTELVEIVDISQRKNGWYSVWNGSTKYLAFSENTTYSLNSKVYVKIPNNDYSEQKTITGLYVKEGESAYKSSSLNDYTALTGNLVNESALVQYENGFKGSNSIISLLANGYRGNEVNLEPKAQSIKIMHANLANNTTYNGYKYIGISAEFKTLLNSAIKGNYGLRFIINYVNLDNVSNDAEPQSMVVTLDTSDMVGAIYSFNTYYEQEVLYSVENMNITSIDVEFYQNGDFYISAKDLLPWYKDEIDGSKYFIPDNIFFKNLSIYFGNDPINTKDKITLYTLNGTTYDPVQKDDLNLKNINLKWMHKDPDSDEYKAISSNADARDMSDIGTNYRIHWYRDTIKSSASTTTTVVTKDGGGTTVSTDYQSWLDAAGTDQFQTWTDLMVTKYLSTAKSTSKTYYTQSDNGAYTITTEGENKIKELVTNAVRASTSSSVIASDTLAGVGWELGQTNYKNWVWSGFAPDTSRAYNKIKVIIEYGGYDTSTKEFNTNDSAYTKAVSAELELTNIRDTSNKTSDDINNALKIQYKDGTGGNYPIYNGTTGELLSRTQVKDRELEAVFKSTTDGTNYFDGNETIIWRIPKTSSMIQTYSSYYDTNKELMLKSDSVFTDYNSVIGDYDENYIYIKRSAVNGTTDSISHTQTYRIKQYYNTGSLNNTVFLYVIKNKIMYKTSSTMVFSQHGTCGTDYTFALGLGAEIKVNNGNWEEVGGADTALTLGSETYHEILFNLYDAKNEEIELTDTQKKTIVEAWTTPKMTGTINNGATIKSYAGYWSGLQGITDDMGNTVTTLNNANNLDFVTNSNHTRILVRPKISVTDITKLRYVVLKAQVTNVVVYDSKDSPGTVQFEQYLPLHFRAKGSDYIFDGSDYIVYDDKGANPTCYNDSCKLLKPNGSVSATSSAFSISHTGGGYAGYFPSLTSGKLVPPPLYITGNTREIAINSGTNYTCPLVIIQNKYEIAAVNNWNGELTVDGTENKILASMIGAGHKDAEGNLFSGVLMGDVKQQNIYNSSLYETSTGLFGYSKGVQTFGFNTDGQGFMGASGVGRITIDGSEGRIISNDRLSYEIAKDSDPRGMEINLGKNYIDMQAKGNSERVLIDASSDTSTFFSITSPNNHELLHIGSDKYFLQTDNYVAGSKGFNLDLKEGIFESNDKLTIKGAKGSSIFFGDTNNYVTLGIGNSGLAYLNMQSGGTTTSQADNNITSTANALKTALGWSQSKSIVNWYSNPPSIASGIESEVTNTLKQAQENAVGYKNGTKNYNGINYNTAKSAYEDALADYTVAQNEYNSAKKAYDEAVTNYNKISTGTYDSDITTTKANLDSATEALNTATDSYTKAQDAYNNALSSQITTDEAYNTANSELEIIEADLENAESDLAIAEYELQQAKKATESAQTARDKAYETYTETQADKDYQIWQSAETTLAEAKETQIEKQTIVDDLNSTITSLETQKEEKQLEVNKLKANKDTADANVTKAYNSYVSAQTTYNEANDTYNQALEAYNTALANKDGTVTSKADAKDKMDKAYSELQTTQNNLNSVSNTYNTALNNWNTIQNAITNAENTYSNGTTAWNSFKAAIEARATVGTGETNYISISNSQDIRINVNNIFKVNRLGEVWATNAHITGEVTATSGTFTGTIHANDGNIGGIAITANGISDNKSWGLWATDGHVAGHDNHAIKLHIGANNSNIGGAPFRVYDDGYLVATNAYIQGNGTFSGTIYATNGTFSGTITGSTIRGNTISGGTISGTTISGGSISGASISASGYVSCSGLKVGNVEYGIKSTERFVHYDNFGPLPSFVTDVDFSKKTVSRSTVTYYAARGSVSGSKWTGLGKYSSLGQR